MSSQQKIIEYKLSAWNKRIYKLSAKTHKQQGIQEYKLLALITRIQAGRRECKKISCTITQQGIQEYTLLA